MPLLSNPDAIMLETASGNDSNATERDLMDQSSNSILQRQMVSNILWVILGSFGTVGNGLLIAVLTRNPNLRSNFYLCVMHLAVADMVFFFTNTLLALKRLCLLALNEPETSEILMCLWQLLPWVFFSNFSLGQSITIAFDRLLCVAAPVRYRKFRVRNLQVINGFMWLIVLVIITYAVTNVNKTPLVPSCTGAQVWQPFVMDLSSYLGIVFNVINILLYAVLLVLLLYRLREGRRKGFSDKLIKKSIQLRAAITSFMLLGVYVSVWLTADLFLLSTNHFDNVTRSSIQPYTNAIMMVGCDLTLIVCIARNHDILQLLRSIVSKPLVAMRLTNTVNPILVLP